MTPLQLQKTGKATTLLSFLGGIGLFLAYFITANDDLLFIGYGYIVLAAIFNLVFLIAILVKAYKAKPFKVTLLRTAGIMLLNLPIVFALMWCVGVLLNTMRLTIVNTTGKDITEVVIDGCDKKQINTIKTGESKTVWLTIPTDCGVFMTYKQGSITKREEVFGYLTTLMGGKATHYVGTRNITGI